MAYKLRLTHLIELEKEKRIIVGNVKSSRALLLLLVVKPMGSQNLKLIQSVC